MPRHRSHTMPHGSLAATVAGLMVGAVVMQCIPAPRAAMAAVPQDLAAARAMNDRATADQFGLCHSGGGSHGDCVVDGDTFWLGSDKIRVADIDAPETHPPRCADEAVKGDAATNRLQTLLNAGPFELLVNGRDRDRYGRALRIVVRDGHSIGDQLVAEGLARRWTGRREPWC